MGKNGKSFFNLAYKLIHFILFVPIKTIKYFFMGFFFTISVFIELLIGIVVMLSFCLYKVLKYVLLFFTFPIVILNMIRRNKKKSNSENTIVEDDEIPAVLPDIDEPLSENDLSDEKIYQFETVADDSALKIDDTVVLSDDENSLDLSADQLIENDSNLEENSFKSKKISIKNKRKMIFFKKVVFLFEFICFVFYKLIKYLILSLSFPILIWNMSKVKKIQNVRNEENDVQSEDNNIIDFNNIDENILAAYDNDSDELIKPNDEMKDNNSLVSQPELISSVVKESTTKDKKKNLKLFLIFEYISYPIYKLVKYFGLGIAFAIFELSKLFVLISFAVYKIFKYMIYSLSLPIMLFNFISHNSKVIESRKKSEERRLIKREEQFKKQLKNQKRQEEQLRQTIKKKRKNEEYVNENVTIEKKNLKNQIDEALNSFFNIPKKIKDYFKNKAYNSVFAKNRRNKRDINRQALLIDFEGEDAEKSDFKVVYQYTAKNKDGKIVTDYFEAFSKVEVHSYLLSEGYEVYNIKTNRWIQFAHQNRAISKVKIKTKDLIFFLTQLSTYIKAGIPLVDSLKIVSRQFGKNKNYKRLFDTVIYDLTMGENFSTALSKQGEAFPKILVNMIKASEMTGELPEVLDDMADYFDEMNKTRKQMITALMYPLIVLVLSIGVIIFIMLFVIPRFVSIYESIDASQIPKFTLAILAISDFLKKYIIYLMLGILIIIFVVRYLYRNIKSFRTICQWFFMHIPVVKNVIIYNEVTTFTKTFASLLSHNVYITDSMEILNRVTNNEIYKMLIFDTITNLAKGEKISSSFKDHWAFPVPAYEMLVTGEQTGQLSEMMAKVADYYQELHKNSVARIKTFIEPILIIFLTAVVGTIVLAIVVPMISLYQTVQNYS